MFVAATLSLLVAVTPQGNGGTSADASKEPVLSAREQSSLADKLKEYLHAEHEYDFADGIKDREKAAKKRRKALDDFDKEWEKAEEKGVMASMVDLRAIFHNCFERERPKHSTGRLRDDTAGDGQEYALFCPSKYKVKETYPLVLSLPGREGGKWVEPEDYFPKTWEGTALVETTMVHIPKVADALELDPVPDYSREGAAAEENRRHMAVLGTWGYVMHNYTVERSKVFLDCGRETCGYGVRLATLFPDRFAGVILRDAVAVDDIRLGSMHSVPVLLLETDANSQTVRALEKRLNDTCPGMATVLKAQGDYPHLESAPDIITWMSDKERVMTPSKVVLEPNHDQFNKAYWANIRVAESLQRVAPDERPRLVATADRAANRITIDCKSVERFEILLNDDLVDLDKEFTLVVNGKAIQVERNRSFSQMKDRVVVRNDWDCLYTASYETSVPKEE